MKNECRSWKYRLLMLNLTRYDRRKVRKDLDDERAKQRKKAGMKIAKGAAVLGAGVAGAMIGMGELNV